MTKKLFCAILALLLCVCGCAAAPESGSQAQSLSQAPQSVQAVSATPDMQGTPDLDFSSATVGVWPIVRLTEDNYGFHTESCGRVEFDGASFTLADYTGGAAIPAAAGPEREYALLTLITGVLRASAGQKGGIIEYAGYFYLFTGDKYDHTDASTDAAVVRLSLDVISEQLSPWGTGKVTFSGLCKHIDANWSAFAGDGNYPFGLGPERDTGDGESELD